MISLKLWAIWPDFPWMGAVYPPCDFLPILRSAAPRKNLSERAMITAAPETGCVYSVLVASVRRSEPGGFPCQPDTARL